MTDSIERIETGPIMSQAVIHGGVVYLAGQVATNAHAPVGQQTSEVLAKIDALLARAGSDKSRLISAVIYLVDVTDYAAMNVVWSAWLPEGTAPVRTTVIAKLAMPGLAIEITIIAAAGDR